MPPWNHIHPALIHFPIALLTVAPLLVLGFAGLILALLSGQEVERYARATPALLAGVREHEWLAQKTTLSFGLLVAAFAVLWALPLRRKQALSRNLELGLLVLWLLLSAGGVLALGLTGHAGGHLVHDLHTHAGPEPVAN